MKILMLYFFLIVLISGCSDGSIDAAKNQGNNLNITDVRAVKIDGKIIAVELALTQEEQQKGLMDREGLDKDSGMLFVLPKSQSVTFWMKNTLIPLDIIYIDENLTINQIYEKVPPCPNDVSNCQLYKSDSNSIKYILEVNSGYAIANNIKEGELIALI